MFDTNGGDLGIGINVYILNNFTTQAAAINNSARTLQTGLEATADKINRAFYRVAAGLGTMGAGFGLIAGALGVPIKLANDFAYQMAKLRTLQNYNIQDMKTFKDAAMDAAKVGLKPMDAAKALYEEAQAGLDKAGDAALFLKDAQKLAVAGDAQLGVVVDGLTSTLNAYGMKAKDVKSINDQFFLSTLYGKETIEDLARHIGHVAPIAASVGVSLKEVLSAVAGVTAAGVPASEAVNGLAMAIKNIIKPTGQSLKALKKLGEAGIHVPFGLAALKATGFTKELKILAEVQKKAPDQLLNLIGSIQGYRTVLHLVTNGQDVYNRSLAEMGSRTGVTQRAFEIMMNTVNKQLQVSEALLQDMGITIGNDLNPFFGPAVKGLNEILMWAYNFVTANPAVVDALATIIVALGTLIMGAGALLTWIAVGRLLGAAFEAIGEVIEAVTSFALIPFLVEMGPVILAALAIGLVAYAIYYAWSQNVGGIQTLLAGWWDNLTMIFEGITTLVKGAKGDIGSMPGELADKLQKAGLLEPVIQMFMLWTRFKHFAMGVWDVIKFAAGAAYYVIAQGVSDISQVLAVLGPILGWIAGLFMYLLNLIPPDVWKVIGEAIAVVGGLVLLYFVGGWLLGAAAVAAVILVVGLLLTWVKMAAAWAGWFSVAWSGEFKKLTDFIGATLAGWSRGFSNFAKGIWTAIVGAMNKLREINWGQLGKDLFSSFVNGFISNAGKLKDALLSALHLGVPTPGTPGTTAPTADDGGVPNPTAAPAPALPAPSSGKPAPQHMKVLAGGKAHTVVVVTAPASASAHHGSQAHVTNVFLDGKKIHHQINEHNERDQARKRG
jgi:TP901 family phage tail tape measure protein